jgi:hypothetical protein
MSESKEQNISQVDVQPGGKRAYSKPEFRFEGVFETRALSCGKVSGSTSSGCHLNRKSS